MGTDECSLSNIFHGSDVSASHYTCGGRLSSKNWALYLINDFFFELNIIEERGFYWRQGYMNSKSISRSSSNSGCSWLDQVLDDSDPVWSANDAGEEACRSQSVIDETKLECIDYRLCSTLWDGSDFDWTFQPSIGKYDGLLCIWMTDKLKKKSRKSGKELEHGAFRSHWYKN
ncbi:hypothetical protein Lal_00019721 [Lupinus albus]|nr:hypothetical protein Lal_00019721 [Lupinus albus]